VRLLHGLGKMHATFDDPNLVSRAGLVPVMALAQRAGLGGLVAEHVRIDRPWLGAGRAGWRSPSPPLGFHARCRCSSSADIATLKINGDKIPPCRVPVWVSS